MSGVVLRCPNCGTTRAAAGECDACQEATVRYYCSNQAPGRWLGVPACRDCGARFGEPPRSPASPAPTPPPSRHTAPVRRSAGPAPAPLPGPRVSSTRGLPPSPAPRPAGPAPATERSHPPDDPFTADRGGWPPGDPASPPPLEVILAPTGRALGGCLKRFVLLVLFVIVMLVMTVSLLGGSLLRLVGF